ncbi:MAG: hypothetical protein IPL28_12455 [Chloroflexi bacterium]|nr:hypothetical protein [Chloroflexota bacterium]
MKKSFPTGKAPQIIVTECYGELIVKAHLEPHVIVKGDDQVTAEAKPDAADVITVSGYANLILLVPEQSQLLIHQSSGSATIKGVHGHIDVMQVHGELICKSGHSIHVQEVYGSFIGRDLDGAVQVGNVNGDINIRNSGGLQIKTLHGDLRGRNINGAVSVEDGQGDISLNTVNEGVTIGSSQRDVNLKNIAGVVQIGHAAGDIRLYDALSAGKHSLKADGDVILRWPANAPLLLTATAPQIVSKISLDEEHRMEENGMTTLSGRIGEGETHLLIQSEQRIILKGRQAEGESDFDFDVDFHFDLGSLGAELGHLGERISSQIGQGMAKLSQKLETKFGPQYGEDIALRTERAIEKAMQKTEEAMRRAEEKMARRPMTPRIPPVPPVPPISPVPPIPPMGSVVSAPTAPAAPNPQNVAAAQMKILEMLEKGVISVEEANVLLKAIE